jgi:hypothetical protein
MTEENFNPDEVCPDSRVYLHHNTITTVRCGWCGLLNPNLCTPTRERTRPPPGLNVINVDEWPTPQGILPAKRRAVTKQDPSTILATIPDFKLGNAEKERQNADKRIQDRKTKTRYTAPVTTVHFLVGVAHFSWDHSVDDQGYWAAASCSGLSPLYYI